MTLRNGGLSEDCTEDSILQEWVFLKSLVYNRYGEQMSHPGKFLWEEVLSSFSNEYKNIRLIIDLLLCLPATSITPSGRRRKVCYKRRVATETGTSQSAVPKEQLTQVEFLIATKMQESELLSDNPTEEAVLVEQEPPSLSEGTPPTLSDLGACIIEQEQDSDINTDKPLESSPPEQVFAEEHHYHGKCSDRDSDSDYDSGIDEDEPMEMSQQEVERNLLSFSVEYLK